VFIRVYLPERFRTVSPAISAALRLWFIFLFRVRTFGNQSTRLTALDVESGGSFGSAKTDHVFDELIPEEEQTAFGVLEIAFSGELDDT
jgi:hypothetical protein